jgi:hypothetical protein
VLSSDLEHRASTVYTFPMTKQAEQLPVGINRHTQQQKLQTDVSDANQMGPKSFVVAVVALLFFMWWIFGPPTSVPTSNTEEQQESERESKAFGCAAEELRSMLKAPSTLKFQFDTISIRESADHDFSISGDFDAQNGFGAMLRQSFRCRVTTTSSNQCIEANCTIL